MRERASAHQMIEPETGKLPLHGVLSHARGQIDEVRAIHSLILVEAREDNYLLSGDGMLQGWRG
jgi:hypothetical protein